MHRYSVFVFCLFFVLLIKAALIRADERLTGDEGKSIAPLLDGMGDLNHPVTTSNEMAQRFFNQGLVLSYGFNHKEAERSFREAARLDPNCAMAYWGIALVLGPNINAAMDDEAVQPAYEAVQKALELAPGASKKEQAYILAVSKRYVDHAAEDRSSLDKAYAQAMGEVARQFPDDPDAVVLYAEALMDLHPWDFWEKDDQPKPWTPEIVSTLEGALKKWPQHPGANHFYIHTVEASHQPDRAMVNADRLGSLVPDAGHLVHMPAHIYIRTGRNHDGSEANERAIESDDAYITQCRSQGIYPLAYHPHNWHFLWATASFEGRSRRAIEAARALTTKVSLPMMRQAGYGTLQHYCIIPMYALVKFGKWNEILNEPAPPEDLLYPTGVWHFARGMAYTRTGQLEEAAKELEILQTIAADTTLRYVTIWDINTTASLIQIAREVLSGELAAKHRKFDDAISHLQKAVEMEDYLTYDEPPPWHSPVRQNLGAVLLEAGHAPEAEKIYREDLKKYPENGWSLFGLSQSLLAQGKTKEAAEAKTRFEKAWVNADVELLASRF